MRKKLLIIEDEIEMAEIYKEKLEREGFEIVLAMDVKEGLEKAKTEKPDLIILDILLPGENGVSFLRKQREDSEIASIPVIAFSNYDCQSVRKEAQALGVKAYLIKANYTPKEFIDRIKKSCNI